MADLDLVGWHLDGLAVAQDHGPRRSQLERGPQRLVRATPRAHLQPVPQQHERRQHGGGLVEDLPATRQRDDDAVQPAGADGDGDGAGTPTCSTSRPIGDHSSTTTDNAAATTNRLRMPRAMSAIDPP
ncbi:MAG: hypothetical protein BGO37_13820 [Cellulomonas sp. 73-92]|uniref:hypothetical protein n=1 Tax=Cellulomonas sp. 73-92 TaxID=1895740 RepID=UPI0009271A51|nr:hypothetical protein [Cellulomonas sp. 73-92]OJV84620.1 MAG: hypothetical protein BGO37_13820 [Cellulomonas sp. 73-92]